ncbi:putative archaeosortase E [Methanocaldococcus lauensis]|nr:putative archaeosortase E [Methanocaldococcus lauensis]
MVVAIFTSGKNKKETIVFLIKFYILFFFLFFILNYFGEYIVEVVAYLSYIFVKLIIPNAKIINNIIYLPNAEVEVIKECTGSFITSGILSLIILYSKNIKEFIIGLFFLLLAFFVNIFRIVLVCYYVNLYPKNPIFYHDIVGYIIILSLIPILVLGYLKVIDIIREGKNAVYKGKYIKNKS